MIDVRARLLVFSFFTFSILFSVLTLGFSFTQITDDDTFITRGSCSDAQVPFKVIYKPDPKIEAECSWALSRSFVRIFLQLIIIATVSALFLSYKKKNNKYFLLLTLLLGLISIISSYSFITDASSLSKSIIYCKAFINFSDANGNPDPANSECVFGRYYGTIAFNILTTLSIIGSTVLAFKKRYIIFNSQNNHHQQQQPLLQHSYDNNQMNGYDSFQQNSYGNNQIPVNPYSNI